MSIPRLVGFTVESADPSAAASFWAAALGGEQSTSPSGGVVVRGDCLEMTFVPEVSVKSVKNRVHFDVRVAGLEPLLDIGARVLVSHPDDSHATLADCEGNEFCAFVDPGRPAVPAGRVFAVCTDSDRPEDIAAWWSDRVEARLGPGGDGTPRWLHEGAGWGQLIWKFVGVDDARVVANRWRWVLQDAEQLLSAGAELSRPGVMIDPDGNDFAVV